MSITERPVALTRAIPRVNLLPPEFAEAQAFRRAQFGFAAALVAAAGVVGVLFTTAHAGIADAQAHVDRAAATSVALQAESAKYAEVPSTYARVDAARASLDQAMALRVEWSDRLDRLSRSIPANVRMTSLTATLTDPGAPSAAPSTPATPASTTGSTIGTVTVNGKANDHNDVAAWLDSQAKVKGYAEPKLASSHDEKSGSATIEDFSGSMQITADALTPLSSRDGK